MADLPISTVEDLQKRGSRGHARRVALRWEHSARLGSRKEFAGCERSQGGQARGDPLLGLQRLDEATELLDLGEQLIAPRPGRQLANKSFERHRFY
jgi:hypothetical protein